MYPHMTHVAQEYSVRRSACALGWFGVGDGGVGGDGCFGASMIFNGIRRVYMIYVRA